jgi:hypothetical protein
MRSSLAIQAERDLVAAMRRLSREQRLASFVEHCALIDALRRAGQQLRARLGRRSESAQYAD